MAEQKSNNKALNGSGKSRLRKLFGKLLLIPAGVFGGLPLCEIVLRIVGYAPPNFYIHDPVVGVALCPNAEGWWTKEGRDYVRINSQGLRDCEHTKAKPENAVRIAVLGDSYAEALQLPMEKAFWAIMEASLRECGSLPGQNVEVINFGVSGYGTAQELLILRQKVWDYSPDIVLLAITSLNDITDDSRALKQSNDVPTSYSQKVGWCWTTLFAAKGVIVCEIQRFTGRCVGSANALGRCKRFTRPAMRFPWGFRLAQSRTVLQRRLIWARIMLTTKSLAMMHAEMPGGSPRP